MYLCVCDEKIKTADKGDKTSFVRPGHIYNMGTCDLPDTCTRALVLTHIFQANNLCPCYEYYIFITAQVLKVIDSWSTACLMMSYLKVRERRKTLVHKL